jgi:hypothetical protein
MNGKRCSMTGTDYSFVERELRNAGYYTDEERGDRTVEAVSALLAVLDAQELDLNDRGAVSALFATLVWEDGELGNKAGPRSEWRQFHLGEVPYGTVLRVKPDAYDTVVGARHNGLTGVLTAVRAGRALVQYHGRAVHGGHEHHPSQLEYLWRV